MFWKHDLKKQLALCLIYIAGDGLGYGLRLGLIVQYRNES